MKKLIPLVLCILLFQVANAQRAYFNNFNSASVFTNPSLSGFENTPKLTLVANNNWNMYRTRTMLATIPHKNFSFYGAYLADRINDGMIKTNSYKAGISYRKEIDDLSISIGGGLSGVDFRARSINTAINLDTTIENSATTYDLGLTLDYKGLRAGIALKENLLFGDLQVGTQVSIHFMHNIKLSENFEVSYAYLFNQIDKSKRNDLYLNLRFMNFDAGIGAQAYFKTSTYFPRYTAGYHYKNVRLSYNYLSRNSNFVDVNWIEHELSLQFAFNTKGKEVSFLPF